MLIATTFLISYLHAQKIYVQGGVNLANISKDANGQTEKNNMLTTFNAGIMARFDIASPLQLETGLLLSGQGAKAETYWNNGNDYVKSKFNPLYIQLPVNGVINFPLNVNKSNGFFIHAGPYIAMGVGGKSKTEGKIAGISFSSEKDIKFNDDDPTTNQQEGAAYDRLKRFDYGVNLGAGLNLNKIIIKANYGLGLSKINSTQTNNSADDKNKYRTLSISLGIPLGK